jgi:hypothetical protein
MDEEEELENTLIGQQEEAPAIDAGDVMMGGLGLGGAAFAAQTGRAPTPTPQGPLSPLAQQVATNDAARQAAARAASSASQPLGNLPRIGTLNPATGPSGGTTLPSQPSLQEARQAAARSAGVNPLSASRLARFGGPGSLIYGAADLGTELATGRGISERIGEGVGEAVGDLLFPGAQSQPAFTEAKTLQDLASMSSSEIQTPPVAPSNALLEMLERADERERMGLPRQAAPGIIDAPVESLAAITQAPAQAPAQALDPTSDEAILARRAGRESQFDPRGPNAPMGRDATRARLGGMTLNEYLNAPAGTPGVSGLRTDPQGRMISSPAPVSVNNFAPQVAGGGNAVGLPILESNPVPMPGTRPGDRNPSQGDPGFSPRPPSLRDPDEGFTPRPPSLRDPDEGFIRPAPNLSDFERDSLARQIAIGGTGSFAGDSAAREARIAARPDFGEAVSDRERRAARGEGLSQADARDLAQGMARGATEGERARALQIQSRLGLGQFEPERELTDLERREIESRISAREAEIARSETKSGFQPRLIDVGGETAMELSPGYFQRIPKDTPEKTGLQATLENLQSDLDSGRLTQEEYDIATKNARDLYIGREEPKPAKPEETSGLIDMGGQGSGTTEGKNKLDAETAQAILNEAGGDKEEARRIARERGFVL